MRIAPLLVIASCCLVQWMPPCAVASPRPPPAIPSDESPELSRLAGGVTGLNRAILIAPLGPLAGLLGSAAGLESVMVNLRFHYVLTDRIAATVVLQGGRLKFLFQYDVIGAKFGPRISLSRPGLAGWYLLPMALTAWGWARTGSSRTVASSPIFGGGLEIGYVWNWSGFVLELGSGVLHSTVMAGKDEARSPAAGGFSPLLNVSLGYGW
ncbi:MAG: hypothetical protein KC502_06950 [Myxococcales bacterium]|nr:hypothetical protein [Myxococcales bacterium]